MPKMRSKKPDSGTGESGQKKNRLTLLLIRYAANASRLRERIRRLLARPREEKG